MIKKILLLVLFCITVTNAQESAVSTTETDIQEQSSTDQSNETGEDTAEKQPPEVLTPEKFDPTEELVEDIPYDFPVDI